jgi:hypothetical protein
LGDAAGNVFLSGAPQIPLGDGLGDANGDALNSNSSLKWYSIMSYAY